MTCRRCKVKKKLLVNFIALSIIHKLVNNETTPQHTKKKCVVFSVFIH